jgi:hydrogenase maturation protease
MAPQTQPCLGTRTNTCPLLVLGVGNILLRDEGVGVRVVEAMEQVELPPEVELFDGATAGLDLLDAIADRQKVIIVDAIDGDSEPGTVIRLTLDDLAARMEPRVSLHEIGVLETLAVARQLGIAPDEVVVIGVRPKDVSSGLSLSPQIAGLVPEIVKSVLAELQR